jgi:hypothetical protein
MKGRGQRIPQTDQADSVPQIHAPGMHVHPLFREKRIHVSQIHVADLGENPRIYSAYFFDDRGGFPSVPTIGKIPGNKDMLGPVEIRDPGEVGQVLVNIAQGDPLYSRIHISLLYIRSLYTYTLPQKLQNSLQCVSTQIGSCKKRGAKRLSQVICPAAAFMDHAGQLFDEYAT